jgi:hypothetical protein
MPRSMLFWVVVSLSHLTKCAYVCLPLFSRFSFLSLQLQRIIHFHHRHGATSRSLVRTSENSVKAKFAEFLFHALG